MKMKNPTLFEDLSNEVLYEIFDYLNAFDVFLTFTSLNERISTILKYIRLHIIVDSIIPNALSINKDDLPIVASLKKFDLQILTQFDIHSLSLILYCMPNLQDINFTFITEYIDTPYIHVLLNGNIWQQILISHVPYLNTFNIYISLLTNDGLFDLQSILDSFRCFLTQFDGWHMAISRLETFRYSIPYKRIVLRTLNYQHSVARYKYFEIPDICCSTFEMISTDSSDANDHRFQSHINSIELFMPRYMERQAIQLSSNIPFRKIYSLVINFMEHLSITSFVENVFTFIYRYFYTNESRQYINKLSSLIDLSSIVTLEFRDEHDLRQLHIVPYILLACVNVKKLIMRTSLLVSFIVIDNPHLTLTFSRIEHLRLFDDYLYFSSKPGTKIVQCFPCLTKIEIRVLALNDYCIPVIDTFLGGFRKLRFMIVEFVHNGLPDVPISRNYIIEKRRQSFGLNRNDEYKVNVMLGDDDLRIWIP
ncbi:unnamed protein product [Rotaria sordida]|uniref:F-box domain-containing protein n=1 Tax=Rotaria sordida TaxID=392033 RepID=A0A815QG70_9BILA|nr:unnamed protein product [Rotaria sordida]